MMPTGMAVTVTIQSFVNHEDPPKRVFFVRGSYPRTA